MVDLSPREMYEWVSEIEKETLVNTTKIEAHLDLLSEARQDVKVLLDRTATMTEQMATITAEFNEKRMKNQSVMTGIATVLAAAIAVVADHFR